MLPHLVSTCAACAGDIQNARDRPEPIRHSRATSCGAWVIFGLFMHRAKFEACTPIRRRTSFSTA